MLKQLHPTGHGRGAEYFQLLNISHVQKGCKLTESLKRLECFEPHHHNQLLTVAASQTEEPFLRGESLATMRLAEIPLGKYAGNSQGISSTQWDAFSGQQQRTQSRALVT